MPASHLYVRHLSHPDGVDSVTRLPDPAPADGRKVPGGWWPPLMLDPQWIARNHSRFDVFHIHFGFDAIGADVLQDVVHELKQRNKPLIYTVHDLRNPHHPQPEAHQSQQNVLVTEAHKLITLTHGAAAAIRARWGRTALVLPHPHVLERAWIDRQRQPSSRFVLGIHVKSLRANMDPFPVLDALASTVADLPGAILQLDIHDEIFDPHNHWFAPDTGAALLAYADHEGVDVRVHPYFSDDELWEYLSSLTVSVLPYRFGSHSGWLEACFDLGTAVIAPSCGFFAEQRQCEIFEFTETTFDAESLDRAVRAAYDRFAHGRAHPRATWRRRRAERVTVSEAHRTLYDSVSR